MAVAQTTNGREPPFLPLRYMEDVEHYCPADESENTTVKCSRPFGPEGPVISLGGEFRWRLEAAENPNFGLAAENVVYPLQRALLHADVRFGHDLRLFVQLGHHVRYGGRKLTRPTDENDLDIQQAFVDVLRRDGPDDGWALRLGRQELGFGSTRFVGAREGANVRLSFDAALASWQSPNRHRVELFAGRPVGNRPGLFADRGDSQRAFYGVYTTTRLAGLGSFPERPTDRTVNLDVYYLGFENDRARFADGAGRERRDAVGVRLYGREGAFDLDWETQVQRGHVGRATVRAWTVATDTGWTFDNITWRPRLGVRADVASGDAFPNDGKLGSLQPLFASPAYFSEAALVAPVNLMSLNPHVTVTPTGSARVQLGWDFLWKAEAADGFYRPGPALIPGTVGGARRVGNQVWLGGSASLTRNLTMTVALVHFEPGPALRQADGRSVNFATVSLKAQF